MATEWQKHHMLWLLWTSLSVLMFLSFSVASGQAFVAPSHRSQGTHRLSISCLSSSSRDNISALQDTDSNNTPKNSQRRTKKNKYEKFSKVDTDAPDPLERLMAESERKNAELQLELDMKKNNKHKHSAAATKPLLPTMNFPDTRDIDPYDPTTFGYTEIGQIVGAHGVAGWLKLQSNSDFAQERLCHQAANNSIRHIKPANKRAPRPIILVQGKHRLNNEYLIQLEGVDDRTTALTYRGATLYTREEDESPAAMSQEEYLVADLVGLEVFLVRSAKENDKSFVGTVGGIVFAEDLCSIPNMPHMHDYLEIIIPRGRQDGMASFRDELVLIPFVPAIVPVVNVAQREIYIDPPTGLLDLTYVRQDKTRIKGFLPKSKSED